MESIEKLREVVKNSPELFQLLTGAKKPGRAKGVPNKDKLEPGKTFEVVQPAPREEDPIPISMAQAKKMLKATRKPRTLSEEAKAKMLENLKKGREALKLKKESRLKNLKENLTKKQTDLKSEVVTKKYVVKTRQPSRTKQAASEEEYSDDYIDEELKRKELLLQKINAIQQSLAPKKSAYVPPPPQLQRQTQGRSGYRMFY